MIAIPESVAFYWGNAIHRAAVNVLAGSTEVPGDLDLREAERFELAHLAARRVRVEFWTMLRALWAATWEPAVQATLPTARLLGYGDHRRFATEIEALGDPSVDGAWAQRAVCGVFELPGRLRLFTRVALVEGEREGQLGFYLIDAEGSCAVSDGLDLGSDWGEDGENRRTTAPGLLAITRAEGDLDPAPFAALAGAAVAAMAAALRCSPSCSISRRAGMEASADERQPEHQCLDDGQGCARTVEAPPLDRGHGRGRQSLHRVV